MTLAISSPSVTYIGNGTLASYSFPFLVFSQNDISVSVVKTTVTPTVTSVLTLGVDYSVSGLNAAGTPASSGTISLISAGQAWLSGGNLASGYSIVIQRIVAITQSTSIRNQGSYYPETIEDSLDYITMICQQLEQAILVLQSGAQTTQPSIVITDQVNGHTYQLIISNGVFGQRQLT